MHYRRLEHRARAPAGSQDWVITPAMRLRMQEERRQRGKPKRRPVPVPAKGKAAGKKAAGSKAAGKVFWSPARAARTKEERELRKKLIEKIVRDKHRGGRLLRYAGSAQDVVEVLLEQHGIITSIRTVTVVLGPRRIVVRAARLSAERQGYREEMRATRKVVLGW